MIPTSASARAELYFFPSLALTGNYDDNLFFTPDNREGDTYLRLRPAVDLGYRTELNKLDLNYSQDLERYNQYQELDSNKARRDLTLDWNFHPSRRLTFGTDADYLKTRTPSELGALTGVQFGRVFAEQRYLSPSLEYRYDNLTSTTARYEYLRDTISNGVGNDNNSVEFDVDRRLASQKTVDFRYRFDRFHFDTGQSVNVNTLLFGGVYAITPRLTLNALAGPRFTGNDNTNASASLELGYQVERGQLNVNYERTTTTILGVGAAVDTETAGVQLALSPVKNVVLRAVPNYSDSTNAGRRIEVYQFLLEAGWQATTYFTVVGSYELTAQHGNLLAAGGNETIRNAVMLGVVLAAPQHVEGEVRRRMYLPSNLGGQPAPVPGELREAPSLEEE